MVQACKMHLCGNFCGFPARIGVRCTNRTDEPRRAVRDCSQASATTSTVLRRSQLNYEH